MPRVLTTRAVIRCPHQAPGVSVASAPVWNVQGGLALVENDTGTLACPFVPYPCIGYRLQSMGLNATTLMGRKVILETDFNQTLTGLPLTMTESHDSYDDSTPAAIPAGAASAPPLPPELLDRVKPVVAPAPPALAYSLTAAVPTPPVVFTLTSPFPLKWVLTLIDTVAKTHTDLTGGLAPEIVVAPAGGEWAASPLSVTVTLSPAWLSARAQGLYQFYMTGVSRRGLSGYEKVDLVVGP